MFQHDLTLLLSIYTDDFQGRPVIQPSFDAWIKWPMFSRHCWESSSKNKRQVWLADSFPVTLANQGHRCKVKKLADTGQLFNQETVLLRYSGFGGKRAHCHGSSI